MTVSITDRVFDAGDATQPATASILLRELGMKYLTGCADLFREGYTDVCQFTLVKS